MPEPTVQSRGVDATRTRTSKMPRLFVDDGGGGRRRPVLFLHAFAGDSSHWTAQLAHLRGLRRAVAFDFSAHGNSRISDVRDYSVRSLTLDVEWVVDELRLDHFVLVGHSMGAVVAAAYAGAHPGHVTALMLVDPPYVPGIMSPDQLARIIKALETDPYPVTEQYWKNQLLVGSTPAVRARVLDSLSRLPRDAVIQLTRDLLYYDPVPALTNYSGPVLAVVTPRNDLPTSIHNVVEEVEHVIVEGAGHWMQLDEPGRFNAILDSFLAKIN